MPVTKEPGDKVIAGTINQSGSFVMRAAQGRPRHAAGADRPDGGDGAALARADPAARRPGVGLVRAGGDRGRGARVHRVGDLRSRAALRLRPGRRGERPDHRLPVRARPRDADVDHGRRRPRRAGRRPDQERRGARTHGEGRHPRRRQDRHADRRQAQGGRDRDRAGLRRERGAAVCGQRRARQRASARRGHRRGRQPSARSSSARVIGFDSPAGKGAVGMVERRRVVLGNAAFLAELGIATARARCRGRAPAARRRDRDLRRARRQARGRHRDRRSGQGDDAGGARGAAPRRACAS